MSLQNSNITIIFSIYILILIANYTFVFMVEFCCYIINSHT